MCSRGGAALERTELGLPRVNSAGLWVGRAPRIMRDPLELKAGSTGHMAARAHDISGAAVADSPACGAWAPMWVTGYDNSCKRKRGPGCSSPSTGLDGGVTQRRRRRAPAAGRGRSFAVRALQGPPRAWIPRAGSRCSCGEATEVREVGEPPEVRNHGGAETHRWRRSRAGWWLGFVGRRLRMGCGGPWAVFIGRRGALGVRAQDGSPA